MAGDMTLTPGPWTNEPDMGCEDGGREIIGSHGLLVATVYHPRDAEVLAAAPRLLNALRSAPIIGRLENPRAFRERQDRWLRETYTPLMESLVM